VLRGVNVRAVLHTDVVVKTVDEAPELSLYGTQGDLLITRWRTAGHGREMILFELVGHSTERLQRVLVFSLLESIGLGGLVILLGKQPTHHYQNPLCLYQDCRDPGHTQVLRRNGKHIHVYTTDRQLPENL